MKRHHTTSINFLRLSLARHLSSSDLRFRIKLCLLSNSMLLSEVQPNTSYTMAGQVPKQMPAMKPPPGVTPNFVNPESLRTYWILMMCMCLTFSTMFVFMRMYTKLVLIKSHGWEDCELKTRCIICVATS